MIELFEYAKEIGNSAANYLLNLRQKGLPVHVKSKEDNSPLYNFDLLMDEFISTELRKTKFQVISEESYNKEHAINSEYWIVDPIDGSKEITSQKGKMSINISFIKNNYPVFGVINVINNSDYSFRQYSGLVKNDFQYQSVKREIKKPLKNLKLITSLYHLNESDRKFIEINKYHLITRSSSAFKFVEIALSNNDIYVRFEGSSEWDTAAGQAIIEANNGKVLCLKTLDRLKYNKPSLRNKPFLAVKQGIEVTSFNKKSLKIELYESNYFSCR